MAKMTKAQTRRMIQAIRSKTQRLWREPAGQNSHAVVTPQDMLAVEKLTTKWLKRLG